LVHPLNALASTLLRPIGTVIVVKELHPLNAAGLIYVTFCRSIVFRDLQSLNVSAHKYDILGDNLTDASLVHPRHSPKSLTLSGRLKLVSAEQPVRLPIKTTPSGIVSVLSALQLVISPTLRTPLGIVTVVRLGQFMIVAVSFVPAANFTVFNLGQLSRMKYPTDLGIVMLVIPQLSNA
jgi:hypothetical protein